MNEASKHSQQMKDTAVAALDDGKGQEIRALDVRGVTDITDFMVVVTGTSDRHVRSLADRVTDAMRERGYRALGTEGEETGDWILVDFGDVIVHVMLPETREFYDLEKLWNEDLRDMVQSHREHAADQGE
jgi:ribosome-associated protein